MILGHFGPYYDRPFENYVFFFFSRVLVPANPRQAGGEKSTKKLDGW